METKTDYSTIEVGRELDELIAQKLFGLTARVYQGEFGETLYIVDDTAERTSTSSTGARLIGGSWEKGYDESGALVEFYGYICPAFSSTIDGAWKAVERMCALGWWYTLTNERFTDRRPYAEFRRVVESGVHEFPSASADTAPLAICRAALIATTSPEATSGDSKES